MKSDREILELAEENQRKARELVAAAGVVEAWEGQGVRVNPVGSLATGLLMTHRDIDFHLYSDAPRLDDGLAAIAAIAARCPVRRIEFEDGMRTVEACLSWHVWCEAADGALWQFDLIHIRRGSRYDGFFEQVAERIRARLTPETRLAILRLKYETPEDDKVFGIEYCRAVLEEGVRHWEAFAAWRRNFDRATLMEWMP